MVTKRSSSPSNRSSDMVWTALDKLPKQEMNILFDPEDLHSSFWEQSWVVEYSVNLFCHALKPT